MFNLLWCCIFFPQEKSFALWIFVISLSWLKSYGDSNFADMASCSVRLAKDQFQFWAHLGFIRAIAVGPVVSSFLSSPLWIELLLKIVTQSTFPEELSLSQKVKKLDLCYCHDLSLTMAIIIIFFIIVIISFLTSFVMMFLNAVVISLLWC